MLTLLQGPDKDRRGDSTIAFEFENVAGGTGDIPSEVPHRKFSSSN
jgi:hypothetical protein